MHRHPILFLMMFLSLTTMTAQAYSQTASNPSDSLSSGPSETSGSSSAITFSQGASPDAEPSFGPPSLSRGAFPVELPPNPSSPGQGAKIQVPVPATGVQNDFRAKPNAQQKFPVETDSASSEEKPGKESPSPDTLYNDLAVQKNDFIVPEIAQAAVFSSVDVNRVVCPSDIKDVVYSKEKNVKVTFSKNNAFVKFLFTIVGGKEVYATKPVEFFVICGDDIYNIIATPKKVPAQTIRLSSGKAKRIKDNASLLGGLPLEKKVLQFIRFAYTDTLPDSFEVTRPHKRYRIWSELALFLDKTALVEGEGLQLKEFIATNVTGTTIRLNEKMFLIPDLTSRTLAVAISKPNLNKNESTKIFIIETTGGQSGGL